MLSKPHRKFCEAIVSGLTGVRAYALAYPRCSLKTARFNASHLRAKPSIQQEITRMRAQADAVVGPVVLTLIEKRLWLARVVRANLARLDPEIDGDLLVSLHVEKEDKKRQVSRIRIFNKLTAISLDTRLAGDEPAKSTTTSDSPAVSDTTNIIRKSWSWNLASLTAPPKPSPPELSPPEPTRRKPIQSPNRPVAHKPSPRKPSRAKPSPDISPKAPDSTFDPRPSSFDPPINPRPLTFAPPIDPGPSSFDPSADSPATPAPVTSDESPITSHDSPLTASPDAPPAAPASTFDARPSSFDPPAPSTSAEPPIDNGYIVPVFTSRPRFNPGPDFAARQRRVPVRRHAWDEC